jgi:hypothetical protein
MSVNWGFVEIESVDADADVFDYRIYWKQWDDLEPQLMVIWCMAAFIMFDSDASKFPTLQTVNKSEARKSLPI